MPIDPDDIIDDFQARVSERTQQALRLSAELEQAEVMLRSSRGEVTVRVNSAGGLSDLRFHPESESLTRDELAALVLATSRRAQAKLAERVSELVAGVYGTGSGTAALVTEAYASRYPSVDDESEGRPDGN
jgi:DNA-binding protein YbaB